MGRAVGSVESYLLVSGWLSETRTDMLCFSLGGYVEEVFKGKTIARQDDLLLMDRLTENMLPEETYHVCSFLA